MSKALGRLFYDVSLFHEKFGLKPTDKPNHELDPDVLIFRAKFLLEELKEYYDAAGVITTNGGDAIGYQANRFNAEKAFDALIDLVYVALGAAYLHRFPFNEGWDRVQEANMKKVRASGGSDERSIRKHSIDIVKPEGWKPPVLSDLLLQGK